MGNSGRGGVGLLRSDATLLDRKIGRVPGGEDTPVGVTHPAKLVHVQEPVEGKAGDARIFGPVIAGNVTIRSGKNAPSIDLDGELTAEAEPGLFEHYGLDYQAGLPANAGSVAADAAGE